MNRRDFLKAFSALSALFAAKPALVLDGPEPVEAITESRAQGGRWWINCDFSGFEIKDETGFTKAFVAYSEPVISLEQVLPLNRLSEEPQVDKPLDSFSYEELIEAGLEKDLAKEVKTFTDRIGPGVWLLVDFQLNYGNTASALRRWRYVSTDLARPVITDEA